MTEPVDVAPEEAATSVQAPATPDDVARAYRLLLGREAGPSEIAPRLRQPVEVLLSDLAASAEHRLAVRTPLMTGAAFPSGRYVAPPSAADSAWLMSLTPDAASVAEETVSWRALLRRARISLALQPPGEPSPTTALPVDWAAPTQREDLERLYRLLFDREMDDEASVDARLRMPLLDLAAALTASEEFRASLVEAVISGHLPHGDALPIGVVSWLRSRFGLDLPAYAVRSAALAHFLADPPMAAALARTRLVWSPAALVECLRAHAEQGAAAWARPTALDRIQVLSRNVEIERLQDIELAPGGVRFTSADPAVIFRLDAESAAAPAVELAFAVGDARRAAAGALYIDYGEGVSEAWSLPLAPRGRRLHHALIAKPAHVRSLRWDPDEQPGETALISVAARPLTGAELQARLAGLSPEALLSIAEAPSAAAADMELSRLINRRAFGAAGRGLEYAEWIAAHEPAPREAQRRWAAELVALSATPLIAVLVPLYDTPAPLLREMIESVLNQVYPHWQLCLADDASPSPHVREMVEAYRAQDSRIKVVYRESNGHISEASNSALELVTADWVALLDHDDVITPDALLAVASEINTHPDANFIYSDEDKLDEAGARRMPFFKPDFSPELLRAQNYLNHLSVHRTANIRAVGGWRKGFEGSQDYDLNLRTLERLDPAQVRHIPRVLYHWRAVSGSTALATDEKSYAVEAGLRALRAHLGRMAWDASAEMIPGLPFYRVRYELPDPPPLVSLIVPTRDRADLLAVCIDGVLERTDYAALEVLIVDNGSTQPETFALFDRLKRDGRVRVIEAAGPFNYSRINNLAVRQSRGEIIGLLNNDIEVLAPGWMREMVSWAILPRIGCVGAKLYYPDDTIQHAGVTLGLGGVAGHPHKLRGRADVGYFGRAAVSHDVSAVTGACLFIRKETWDEVGGLDERLAVAFNDVDFCLRVREAGYRNVFTPFAELYHHESPSRGEDIAPEKRARFLSEVSFMEENWAWALKLDPFYSPNLTRLRDDYSLSDAPG